MAEKHPDVNHSKLFNQSHQKTQNDDKNHRRPPKERSNLHESDISTSSKLKDSNSSSMERFDETQDFLRRHGTSGIGGQLYEVHLLALLLWEGIQRQHCFHLATNMEEAGNFDDIVYSYSSKNLKKHGIIFLQAKYREKPAKDKMTFEKLLSESRKGDFSLKKYFKTFQTIKANFSMENSSHTIFRKPFETTEFIIFSTAYEDFKGKESNFSKIPVNNEVLFDFVPENYFYKLHMNGNKSEEIKNYFMEPDPDIDFKEVEDFLSKLKIYLRQPNIEYIENVLNSKIKEQYALENQTAKNKYSIYIKRILSWWFNESQYLTEKCPYVHDLADSIYFSIRTPVYNFTGREAKLKELHSLLQNSSENKTSIAQVTSVTGLGGIGKTQIVRKYIQQYCRYYGHILWINAESPESLKESFMELVTDNLKIRVKDTKNKERSITSIIKETYRILCDRKCLIIFDNVEEPSSLKEYLPWSMVNSFSILPHVIVTSRSRHWGNGWPVLDMDCFTKSEAMQYVITTLDETANNNQQLEKFIECLQCLPLALHQATEYIYHQKIMDKNYTINKYLDSFEEKQDKLLKFKNYSLYNDNEKTTYSTWAITIEKIRRKNKYGKLAVSILEVMAYLAPENISRQLFRMMAKNDDQLKEAVCLLVKYSMIEEEESQSNLWIHRLVQRVIRLEVKNRKYNKSWWQRLRYWLFWQRIEEEEQILDKTLKLLSGPIDRHSSAHILTVWDVAHKYDCLIKEHSITITNIISYFHQTGKYQEGLNISNKYMERIESVCGPLHPNTLAVKHQTGNILLIMGNLKEASNLLNDVHKIRCNVLGSMHPDTLRTRHCIGDVLQEENKLDNALKVYEEVFAKKLEILGLNHPSTLTSWNNIANILQKQGNFSQASDIYQKVYDIRHDELGPMHFNTLVTKYNIGCVLHCQGYYTKAYQVYEDVYTKQVESLGSTHPDTLNTRYNIASVLKDQGETTTALSIFQDVYEKRRNILGSNHALTLSTLSSIESLSNVNSI